MGCAAGSVEEIASSAAFNSFPSKPAFLIAASASFCEEKFLPLIICRRSLSAAGASSRISASTFQIGRSGLYTVRRANPKSSFRITLMRLSVLLDIASE